MIGFIDMDAFYHTSLALPSEVVVVNDQDLMISVPYSLRKQLTKNSRCPSNISCYLVKAGERMDMRNLLLDLRETVIRHVSPCFLFRVDSLVIPFLKYKEQINDICEWLYDASKLPFSVGVGADIWEAELMCERAKATKISVAR